MTPEERRLLDGILQRPRHELIHDSDCPACNFAYEIGGDLAAHWDPNDTWGDVPAVDGLPGDSLLTQVFRTVAYTLHRKLPGHQPCPAYADGITPEMRRWA